VIRQDDQWGCALKAFTESTANLAIMRGMVFESLLNPLSHERPAP